jgi:glycerophosphoryl diester phosphodiesterase
MPHAFARSAHPYAFAHRGGALLPANIGVENTQAAFQNAVDLGYRHLETDVHVSSDGVVYAFHDANLRRMTGRPGLLRDYTARELDDVRVDGREPLPRMGDLLAAFPTAYFSIDVKADDAVDATVELIREADAAERVLIGSFDHRRILRLRAALPKTASCLSRAEVARFMAGGPVPRGTCASVPIAYRGIRVLTPRFIARARRRGVAVYAWTIDERAEMELLLDLGVDGIVSDRPDVLREVLLDRGQWRA